MGIRRLGLVIISKALAVDLADHISHARDYPAGLFIAYDGKIVPY